MPDEDPEAWRSFMASLDPAHMLGPLAAHWNVSGRMCMCRATLRSGCVAACPVRLRAHGSVDLSSQSVSLARSPACARV
jgi:hypothetical protein